jgi:hypothetical protein
MLRTYSRDNIHIQVGVSDNARLRVSGNNGNLETGFFFSPSYNKLSTGTSRAEYPCPVYVRFKFKSIIATYVRSRFFPSSLQRKRKTQGPEIWIHSHIFLFDFWSSHFLPRNVYFLLNVCVGWIVWYALEYYSHTEEKIGDRVPQVRVKEL